MTNTVNSTILQETLQGEYPLLDTSLLAALISELPPVTSTSDEVVNQLRETLQLLSVHAEQADSDVQPDIIDTSTSTDTPDELRSASCTTPSLSSAPSTMSSSQISALDFLQILFPHLSSSLILQALNEAESDEADMDALVDHLLNLEYIQDLAERGVESLSDGDESSQDQDWQMATSKGNRVPQSRPKSKRRQTARAVPLVDIRQRQHRARESSFQKAVIERAPRSFSDDPWTRLSSLAARASELLPSANPGYFMTYFHAPKSKLSNGKTGWKGEADALRHALVDLTSRHSPSLPESELKTHIDTLSAIVLHPPDDFSVHLTNAEQISQVESDIKLCIYATGGDGDAALDLVYLLQELDKDFEFGEGIAHVLPVASTPSTPASPDVSAWSITQVATPPASPPPLSNKHPPSSSSRASKQAHKAHTWTLVEPRQPASKPLHPHAAFIPAYGNNAPRRNVNTKGSGNQFGKGGKGDVGELSNGSGSGNSNGSGNGRGNFEFYRRRAGDLQSQREEALREASRHWQSGNAKSHGGEVAIYYAEKARELQEQQRKWALDAARVMVEEKRRAKNESDTLDLHGLTVTEACTIVRETLQHSPPSPGNTLKIITGRGNHSTNQIGVLGPAVREMLIREGYSVSKWDGGLVVKGLR